MFKSFLRFILKPLSFLPALCVMYLIFSFSAQDGSVSSNLSYRVSRRIITVVDDVLQEDLSESEIEYYTEVIHLPVRKLAHMGVYCLLAISLVVPLYVYGLRGFWLFIFSLFLCVAFACGDEYHQSFVDGRAPALRDVGFDSIGAAFGIIFAQIISFIGRVTIFRPLAKGRSDY